MRCSPIWIAPAPGPSPIRICPTSGAAARAAFDVPAGATGRPRGRARRAEGGNPPAGNMTAGAETKPAEAPATPPRPRRQAQSRSRACRSSSISTRPRRASTPRSAPRSASPSGWCGSGRTISACRPTRAACARSAGAYEREAIRAHVLGRFGDMLLAVESHPAMLLYLDNARSIGPDSVAGRSPEARPQREPRARDPRAAYARRAHGLHPGRRHPLRQRDHRLDRHPAARTTRSVAASSSSTRACTSPAPQTVIGKSYPDTGFEQGRAVLATLARHPATARHVASQARAPFRRR